MSELQLIDRIRTQSLADHRLILGPGDDCSVAKLNGNLQLTTVDTLMEGRHFKLPEHSPSAIGHKALAVSISDIAAMGGIPDLAFVSLCLPNGPGFIELGEQLMASIFALAKDFDMAIAGGDSNSWDGPLVVSTTVTGSPHSRGPVYRSGAKTGDIVLVTGPLGGSLLHHHLHFTPRVNMAKAILDLVPIHSMIDISDGLATDLRHICQESQVAAQLIPEQIPIRQNLNELPREEALRRALSDGEDFELCFTVSPESWRILANSPLATQIYEIGKIVPKDGPQLSWQDGPAIEFHGFEH